MIIIWGALNRAKGPIHRLLAGCAAINIAFDVALISLGFPHARTNSFGQGRTVIQGLSGFLLLAVLSSTILSQFLGGVSADEETPVLLPKTTENQQLGSPLYGTVETEESDLDHKDDDYDDDDEGDEDGDEYMKERQRQRLEKSGNWLTYLKGYSIFVPFLIPKEDRVVQLCILVNISCLLAQRAFNILIPRQLGIITDLLVSGAIPIKELAIWLTLSILEGGAGLGKLFRSFETHISGTVQPWYLKAIVVMALPGHYSGRAGTSAAEEQRHIPYLTLI